MIETVRLDYQGTPKTFSRTAQGFLRIDARLTRAGVFKYESGREYRSIDELFRSDFLASFKGAPVIKLHPAESGGEPYLTPCPASQNAGRQYTI